MLGLGWIIAEYMVGSAVERWWVAGYMAGSAVGRWWVAGYGWSIATVVEIGMLTNMAL